MSTHHTSQARDTAGRFEATTRAEAVIDLPEAPALSPEDFSAHIRAVSGGANGARKAPLPIISVKDYWKVSFNAEHDMSLYVVETDAGEVFATVDYGIHVVSYDENSETVCTLSDHEDNLRRRQPLTRERIDHQFFELDENGSPDTRDERCTEILDYIIADLGITLTE